MKNFNYVFVGGKKLGYETFNYLLKKNFRPLCVVPNRDDNGKDNIFNKSVLKLAKSKKVKIVQLNRVGDFIKKNVENLDAIFCLGSTRILPKNLINVPKLGTLNIHPSLLPSYRGRYSLVHAIADGKKFTGFTTHWIGAKIDSGKVISKKKIKIENDDTGETIYEKFTNGSIIEFKKIFNKMIKRNTIKTYNLKKNSNRYKKKHFPNNGQINWSWGGKKIFNYIRSMIHEPFPPPEIKIGSKTYYIVSKKLITKKKLLKSPK